MAYSSAIERWRQAGDRNKRIPAIPAVAAIAAVGALAAYELFRAARITAGLGNEDTSIIWFAAREWMKGRIHQPNYYGQSYGSTLEAIPIGLVHAMHVSYGTATAAVLAAIEIAGWAVLAWASWRRGHRLVALLAVAAPVIVGAYHLVYVSIELQAPGPRLLVIVAAALLIAFPSRLLALGSAVLLLGIGLQFDPASALLALPVVSWYALAHPRSRAQLYAIAAGAIVPVALFAYSQFFYRRHPDYAFHIAPTPRPGAETLGGSVRHLGEFFQLYAPELWRSWLVPLVALVALVGLLLATRKAVCVVPAAIAAALVVYAMSTTRARPEWALGPLLPRGRILLALPALMWFLCFVAADAGVFDRLRQAVTSRAIVALIVAACVASAGLRAVDFDGREGFWQTKAVTLSRHFLYGFQPNAQVMDRCRADLAIAHREGIGLIVYDDQHAAYTCAAEAPSQVTTLVPRLERRTWLLYDEYHHVRTRLMVTNAPPRFCDLAGQRASCSLSNGYAVLRFPAQPPLPLLASMGFPVRDFGPHCHPTILFATCRIGEHGVDLARRPFAAPPAEPAPARAAIARAFATMFDATPAGTLPAVEEGSRLTDAGRRLVAARSSAAPAVLDVTFLDDHEAVVRFRLRGLTQTGEAVVQEGAWRVAAPTFCATATRELSARKVDTGPACVDFRFR